MAALLVTTMAPATFKPVNDVSWMIASPLHSVEESGYRIEVPSTSPCSW